MMSRLKSLFTCLLFILMLSTLFSCRTIPGGITAVGQFDKAKYLGKWYEIARFDFRFERNLDNTSAEYSLNPDGTVRVVNRGYDYVKKEWKQAVGKAKSAGKEDVAMLKVSFFGPFYAGYNVIALDPDYQYALVCGNSREYLWILSRKTTIPEDIRAKYLDIAKNYGFDISKLIFVQHNLQ